MRLLAIYLSDVPFRSSAEKAWKQRIHSNGKEFSAVPFRMEKGEYQVVYHLQKKSGNFGWNVSGKTNLVFPNGKFPRKTGFLER